MHRNKCEDRIIHVSEKCSLYKAENVHFTSELGRIEGRKGETVVSGDCETRAVATVNNKEWPGPSWATTS